MENNKKIETTKFCECEEPEIDKSIKNYVFYMCKKCKKAVKRKETICAYYLTSGYCSLAEANNYTLACRINGDHTKCKSGHQEREV